MQCPFCLKVVAFESSNKVKLTQNVNFYFNHIKVFIDLIPATLIQEGYQRLVSFVIFFYSDIKRNRFVNAPNAC